MHIGNVLLESIHLTHSQLFINSMFALLLQELEWKEEQSPSPGEETWLINHSYVNYIHAIVIY